MVTVIKDADGVVVATHSSAEMFGNQIEQNIGVPHPRLWSPEKPCLYTAHSSLYQSAELKDEQVTRFGIRTVVYDRDRGMLVNGAVTKFKGVCLHHDLGPLGAAVNRSAIKRQITLHVLPHWNWEGRERKTTPVFAYTNHNSAELFVNGVSQEIQKKNLDSPQNRYRLMRMDVKYIPGTVKVVAFDDRGKPVAEKKIHTAGKPHHLELSADRTSIAADGKDLAYVTVTVVDKNGIPCPTAANRLHFRVSGEGRFKAVCNGDATSLEMFHLPTMKAFSGKLVVLVQSSEKAGNAR